MSCTQCFACSLGWCNDPKIDSTTQVKHADFYAAITIVLPMGLWRITTINTVETRDKSFLP